MSLNVKSPEHISTELTIFKAIFLSEGNPWQCNAELIKKAALKLLLYALRILFYEWITFFVILFQEFASCFDHRQHEVHDIFSGF